MYAKFFGLRQPPFSIAPDPRYLFMSERHREALAHLLYGVKGGGGFVLLTGEIGAGKTTVCRCFLEQVPPRCNVAYIFNPKLTVPELLQTVCDEFRIPLPALPPAHEGTPRSIKEFIDPLNEFLLRTHSVGQTNVLIIDEAQNLSADVLEQLRLLTNLETAERKLLQIILIGQPELRDMLARPELEQLAQRVIARYHLSALDEAETARYVAHRLGVAGGEGASPFDKAALKRIHQLSRGVPRRVNLLCDRALLGGYATGQAKIGVEVIERAAAEVFGDHHPSAALTGWPAQARRAAPWAGGLLAGVSIAAAAAWVMRPTTPAPAAAQPATMAAAVASGTLRGAAGSPAPVPPASAPASNAAPATAGATATASPAALSAAELRATFNAELHGEADAWRELASAWGVTLGNGNDFCASAMRQALPCFKGPGSLALVRQLDRPGVLVLYDGDNRPFHVLLTTLTADTATLRRGKASVTVPLATLGAAWRGDFGTFWRAPPGYAGPGTLTTANPEASAWLMERLGRALRGERRPGSAAEPAREPFTARVASFQVAQGLSPDGVAGPMTVMLLNRATGVDEPRLLPPPATTTARR
ncbi:MAG TPA: AAA family ATPase [Ideonella sp.]|uniref:AAA family ATPase n=1 Tax=Ideonella sp. TaxID=1929293 RepID=UPI002E3380D9|nr:AAA family ATPase [Ideonella sp.]HEX5683773.1 AAA family ATPase [Ideonella sp.]